MPQKKGKPSPRKENDLGPPNKQLEKKGWEKNLRKKLYFLVIENEKMLIKKKSRLAEEYPAKLSKEEDTARDRMPISKRRASP